MFHLTSSAQLALRDLYSNAGFADSAVNQSSNILMLAASLSRAASSYNRTALDLANDVITAQDSILGVAALSPTSFQGPPQNGTDIALKPCERPQVAQEGSTAEHFMSRIHKLPKGCKLRYAIG